jgi:hypothetical protein
MAIRQRQPAIRLQFLLLGRPVHPELFKIHCSQDVRKGPYEARLWITQAGHVVSFHLGKTTLTEVVTDDPQKLPQRRRLLTLPFKGEQDESLLYAQQVRYMANSQVETVSQRLYRAIHQELSQAGQRRGMLKILAPGEGQELGALSLIEYDAQANRLGVFAYHAFPAELTIIKTQSIFEVLEPAR